MFDNIISIDIGASSVKLIKARRNIRNFEIITALIEDINQDEAMTDYAAALRTSLAALTVKENPAESNVIITVSSDLVFFRNISFPFSDMNKIREAIPFEAEENIPYPFINDNGTIIRLTTAPTVLCLQTIPKPQLAHTCRNPISSGGFLPARSF